MAKPKSDPAAEGFLSAVRKGDINSIRQMMNAGLDLKAIRDDEKSSALHVAAMSARKDVCSFLIESGADVNARDGNAETPLHDAFYGGDIAIAELLLAHGANINAKSHELYGTLLALASGAGKIEWMQFAIDHKANVNLAGSSGIAPVAASCMGDSVPALQLLLSSGASVDCRAEDGQTPLMYAGRHGNLETMQVLVQNGAQVNAQANDGLSPLMTAVLSGKPEPVKFLLDHGAMKEPKDKYERTALDYAERGRLPKTIKLLK